MPFFKNIYAHMGIANWANTERAEYTRGDCHKNKLKKGNYKECFINCVWRIQNRAKPFTSVKEINTGRNLPTQNAKLHKWIVTCELSFLFHDVGDRCKKNKHNMRKRFMYFSVKLTTYLRCKLKNIRIFYFLF